MIANLVKKIFLIVIALYGMTAMSQQQCAGGWQIEQLGYCANKDAGCQVDLFERPSCQAQVTDEALGCGPASRVECHSMNCPGSIPKAPYTIAGTQCRAGDTFLSQEQTRIPYPPYFVSWAKCETLDKPGFCENSACAVKTWKSCRHKDCGDEIKFCSKEGFKSSFSETSCGKTQTVTAPNSDKPTDETKDGKRLLDYYEQGSACITCDDIPMDTTANIQKRFDCLDKGLKLAEQAKPGFSFRVGTYIMRQFLDYSNRYTSYLTQTQFERLAVILNDL